MNTTIIVAFSQGVCLYWERAWGGCYGEKVCPQIMNHGHEKGTCEMRLFPFHLPVSILNIPILPFLWFAGIINYFQQQYGGCTSNKYLRPCASLQTIPAVHSKHYCLGGVACPRLGFFDDTYSSFHYYVL